MKYKKIILEKETVEYCHPELIIAFPFPKDDGERQEQDLIRLMMRQNLCYLFSAQLVTLAQQTGNKVEILEQKGVIYYNLVNPDFGLEEKITQFALANNCSFGGQDEIKN